MQDFTTVCELKLDPHEERPQQQVMEEGAKSLGKSSDSSFEECSAQKEEAIRPDEEDSSKSLADFFK